MNKETLNLTEQELEQKIETLQQEVNELKSHLHQIRMAKIPKIVKTSKPRKALTDIEYMQQQISHNPGAVVLFLRKQGIDIESTTSKIKLQLGLRNLVKLRSLTKIS